MDITERKTLQDIRSASESYAIDVPNPHWQHAFTELAMAADRCDAMIARSTNSEADGNDD